MDKHDSLLPLNCVDTGFLSLISINETPCFHWMVEIDGEINSASLDKALGAVLRAHPNLSARMCTRHMRPFRRIEHPTESTLLTYLDLSQLQGKEGLTDSEVDLRFQEALAEWFARPFDSFREFPIRVLFVRRAGSQSHLIFSFDHSSLDGIRSLRFIQEVVRVYNGGSQPEVSRLSDLRRKGDELLGFARSRRAMSKGLYRKVFSGLFYRFFIAPLKPPSRVFHDKSQRPSVTAYLPGSINQAELDRIRSRAKAAGFTMNDVLLAACFRVIHKCNSLHHKAARKVTIMVPVDIGPESFKGVISNQLSYVSVSILPGERADPSALIRKIRKDMRSMVDSGIPFSIIYFLHFVSPMRRYRC